jgi:hypothetical protein
MPNYYIQSSGRNHEIVLGGFIPRLLRLLRRSRDFLTCGSENSKRIYITLHYYGWPIHLLEVQPIHCLLATAICIPLGCWYIYICRSCIPLFWPKFPLILLHLTAPSVPSIFLALPRHLLATQYICICHIFSYPKFWPAIWLLRSAPSCNPTIAYLLPVYW